MKNLAYSLICIISVGWLLYIGSSIILPLLFATLFAIFLYPIDRWLLARVKFKAISIILSFLSILVPLSIVILLFSAQLINIAESLPSIGTSLEEGMNSVLQGIREHVPILKSKSDEELSSSMTKALDGPLNIVGKGVVNSTTFLFNFFLTFIYTFFILFYRKSFKSFIIYHFEKELRPDIKDVLSRIKATVQAYVGGLGIVIILLSVCNSLGLWIIGIDYPIFWGTLAGILAIIPYVGTALGGMLPFFYALATTDQSWQPIAVVVYYLLIQALEGNLITPKIVGEQVNINPLIAILALIFFGNFWGVGGVVLALPLISILRIIFSQFESTEALAVLMSNGVAQKYNKFKKMASE